MAIAPLTFLRQTVKDFHTTGAVAPSSSYLARAMVASLPGDGQIPDEFRILEAGPGTGSFTQEIVKRLGGRGRLDLYEVSEMFVQHLEARLRTEACFASVRDRIQLRRADVRQLPAGPHYDAVVSGLPFNNFSGPEVREFLEHFRGVLKPGGTLTFFEYVAIRRLQTPFVGRERRRRLREIAAVVKEFARAHQFRSQIVPLNLPPARVRHLRFGPAALCVKQHSAV